MGWYHGESFINICVRIFLILFYLGMIGYQFPPEPSVGKVPGITHSPFSDKEYPG